MADEKSWISNAWTCKHVVCSGTKNYCFMLPELPAPSLTPYSTTPIWLKKALYRALNVKQEGDAKKNAI